MGKVVSIALSVVWLAGPASAANLISNGSFESNPIGTGVSYGTGGAIDSTTFTDWRFFTVGAPAIAGFAGTIQDASLNEGNPVPGGIPGSHAMRLDVGNPDNPPGVDYALDRDAVKVSVAYETNYIFSFDAVLYGLTGGAFTLDVTLAEYDGTNVFTGTQTDFSPALSGGFQKFTYIWTPLNPNTTQINIAFRLRSPGFSSAMGLDNVEFTTPEPRAVQLALHSAIAVTGTVGGHYRVEYATALAPTTWLLLQDIPSLPGSPFMVYDSAAAPQPQRSYRAVVAP